MKIQSVEIYKNLPRDAVYKQITTKAVGDKVEVYSGNILILILSYKQNRSKKFEIEYELMHESFNGYEHRDGTYKKVIEARDVDSAKNKLKKWFNKEYNSRRWYNIISILEHTNEV